MAEFKIRVRPNLQRSILSPTKFARLFREAQREVAEEAELIFGAYALKGKTQRLTHGIFSFPQGEDIIVAAEAKNPLTGFDYVGVTRVGHRGMIVPKRQTYRRESVVLSTGRKRKTGHEASLRFVIGGRVLYRRSTKGFHPAQDWAELALPRIASNSERIMGKLARKIEVL